MKKITIFILLALLLTFGATPAYAQPAFPHAFYGSVTVNGSLADDGTQVSATVDNGTVIPTQNPVTTKGGTYGIDSPKLLVQGDGLSGTITFYVNGVEAEGQTAIFEVGGGPTEKNLSVTIPRPPGGGGIGPRRVPPGTTDVRGEVSAEGVFEEPVTAFSDDELCTLTIPEGTEGLTEELEPLDEITILREDEPPDPPEEADIVLAYDLGPDGATFYPPVTLTFSYDPDDIPEGKDVLVVAYYDEIAEAWVYLEGEVDTVTKTITVSISHFTTFAIIARAPAAPPIAPPVPAAFTSSSLTISPVEVDIGETVTISVLVANTGEEQGSYTITLKIDGVVEETKQITLAGGASETVTFTTAKDKAGAYSVGVDGLTGLFTIKEAPPPPAPPPPVPPLPTPPPGVNWTIWGPVIAVAVFLAIFLPIRLRRRRRFG